MIILKIFFLFLTTGLKQKAVFIAKLNKKNLLRTPKHSIILKMAPQQAFSIELHKQLQNLTWEKEAVVIIEIILNDGIYADYKLLFKKYSKETIRSAVCCITTFDRKTRNFLSITLNIPIDNIYDCGYIKRFDFYNNKEYIEISDEEKYYAGTQRKITDR